MSDHSELLILAKNYLETGVSTFSVMEVAPSEVHKYVVIRVGSQNGNILQVTGLVEKPRLKDAPTLFALPGRYFFVNKVFDYIAQSSPGVGGKNQLTDAMIKLPQIKGCKLFRSR